MAVVAAVVVAVIAAVEHPAQFVTERAVAGSVHEVLELELNHDPFEYALVVLLIQFIICYTHEIDNKDWDATQW